MQSYKLFFVFPSASDNNNRSSHMYTFMVFNPLSEKSYILRNTATEFSEVSCRITNYLAALHPINAAEILSGLFESFTDKSSSYVYRAVCDLPRLIKDV